MSPKNPTVCYLLYTSPNLLQEAFCFPPPVSGVDAPVYTNVSTVLSDIFKFCKY